MNGVTVKNESPRKCHVRININVVVNHLVQQVIAAGPADSIDRLNALQLPVIRLAQFNILRL